MLEIKDPCTEIFSSLRDVNDQQKQFLIELRHKADEVLEMLKLLPIGRRQSIAITKLEECILFANKSATFGS